MIGEPMTDEQSDISKLIAQLDIPEALASSGKEECYDYGTRFYERAKLAGEAGNEIEEKAWRLLGQVAQISLDESNTAEPFQAMFQTSEGRSILPSDLDDDTKAAMKDLAEKTENAELRSRLYDIAWVTDRDANAARRAVENYLESARNLKDPEHWVPYAERMERALRLSWQIKDEHLRQTVLDELTATVVELNGEDPLFLTIRLMELLIEFREGDLDQMSGIADKAAQTAEQNAATASGAREADEHFRRARSHLENLAECRRLASDDPGRTAAQERIAIIFEHQAENHAAENEFLLASIWLERAHEAYRGSGMKPRADALYPRLREYQRQATGQMQRIETKGVDVSEITKRARESVSGLNFQGALLALAMLIRPTDFQKVTERTKELISQFPLQNLFGGVVMGPDGRTTAIKTPGLMGDDKDQEQALWERVVENVNRDQAFDVQAIIAPAINQISVEHSPVLRDFDQLVVNNPFVPEGHEELYARGFLHGFRWDFAEALSILLPQLENSLRHLLEMAGVDISTRDRHGIQDLIPLGRILSEKTLEEILTPDIVKELKVLLSDRHGPRLRDYSSHGAMAAGGYFQPSAIYAWWLILHLCINPVYRRFIDPRPDNGTEPS